MKFINRKNLKVVEPEIDPTDTIIDQIIDELREEDPQDDLEERIAKHRKRFWIRVIVISVVLISAVTFGYLFVTTQTYSTVRVLDAVENDAGNYLAFADGMVKYSKDGISFLSSSGKEKWNHSYQIKHPIVERAGETLAIGDKSGTSIAVFDKNGLKGEISTTLPIQKICVSEQGVVAAILKNDYSPEVICYDATGNILVEHKTAMASTGYPMDISISPNGEILLVTYLYTQENKVTTKIAYFNFGDVGKDKVDHQVAEEEFEDEIIPETFFMSQDVSALVGEKQILIYKGEQIPEKSKEIKIKEEIKSVFHDEENIGVILKSEKKEGYELRVYNENGVELLTTHFTDEYSHVKIEDGQIMMHEGNQLVIYMLSGQKRFEGQTEANILDIVPMTGFNKYLVMNTSGVQKIRLVQ